MPDHDSVLVLRRIRTTRYWDRLHSCRDLRMKVTKFRIAILAGGMTFRAISSEKTATANT